MELHLFTLRWMPPNLVVPWYILPNSLTCCQISLRSPRSMLPHLLSYDALFLLYRHLYWNRQSMMNITLAHAVHDRSQFKTSKFSVVFWNFQKSENSHAIEGEDCSRLQVPNNGNFFPYCCFVVGTTRRPAAADLKCERPSAEKQEWNASSSIPEPCHANTCMSKCTVCNWSVVETPTVQIFLHNFSYPRVARELRNEASSCTQDRLEIIVDVHRLIWKYTVTVIQSTVNHGSHKSMRSFLAQGVTNKTKFTEGKITVPYCGANICGHGQVTVNDDTQISDVFRRSDPYPCNLKRNHRAVPQPPRGTKPYYFRLWWIELETVTWHSVFDGLNTIRESPHNPRKVWRIHMGMELQIISIDVNCVSEPVHNVDYFRSINDEKKWTQYGILLCGTPLDINVTSDVLPLNWTY